MSDKLRPFHRLSDAEFKALLAAGKTWGWLMKHYAQPSWCQYPDALEGMMGCWSLVGLRSIKRKKDCEGCELCRK